MMQLALFEARSARDLMWERSRHSSVAADVLAILAVRSGEWLDYSDFRDVMKKHGLRGIMGHVLSRICRAGQIDERNIYYGDEQPGGKNYLGFHCVYRIAEEAAP